jgi:hypothetical protein
MTHAQGEDTRLRQGGNFELDFLKKSFSSNTISTALSPLLALAKLLLEKLQQHLYLT